MFFQLSKLFWFVAAPTNALVLLALLGTIMLFTRASRLGRWLALGGTVGLLICGMSPVSNWLMRPLEDRFQRPKLEATNAPSAFAGIIVLGGAIGSARGFPAMNDAAERMTESAALALRFPDALLAFTGGDGSILRIVEDGEAATEAEAARRFYVSLAIDENRLILEDASRNTRENAVFLKPLLDARKAGGRWLLVTSAWHMPRSVGIFRRAGIDVVPYPVDFMTRGTMRDYRRLNRGFSQGLALTDLAAKEWIGLIAYRLMGYTDTLVPGPG